MRRSGPAAWGLAALLAAPAGPAAAFTSNVGGDSAHFLSLGAGARAQALGGAYGPVAEGPDAIYWNPAGLAGLERPQASYSHAELMKFFHHDFFAYAHPVPPLGGTLGVAGTLLTQDVIAARDNVNADAGRFSPNSVAIAIAYARSFWERGEGSPRDYFLERTDSPWGGSLYDDDAPWQGSLKAGLAVKLLQESLGERRATSFAVDGGALYRPYDLESMALSFAFRNVGSRHSFIRENESLPVEVDVGAAFDLRFEGQRLLPAAEVAVPYYGHPNLKLGLEYGRALSDDVEGMLRGGYRSLTVSSLGATSGATVGLGLRLRRVSLDFAFQPLAELGETFRMGLGWRF